MRSHDYQFTPAELIRIVAPTGLSLVILAVVLNGSHRLGWLPQPAPSWDPDRTVLAHQARACRKETPAQVVLTGDSTCLVGVDALQLSEGLKAANTEPRSFSATEAATQQTRGGESGTVGNGTTWQVLNLALYLWLDLRHYGELVSEFAAEHPGEVRAVVLLVSPAKLIAEETTDEPHREFWEAVRSQAWQRASAGGPAMKNDSSQAGRRDWAGAQIFREHLLTHVLATPLHGSAAAHFGFSSEIDAYMTRHRGSVLTFGTSVLPRRTPGAATRPAAWVVTRAMEADSRAFRAKLPPGVKLFIGLTPGMAGASSPNEHSRRLELLQGWNAALNSNAMLTNLPSVLPDVFFSSGGHLNATGQRVFTRLLARELAPLLP